MCFIIICVWSCRLNDLEKEFYGEEQHPEEAIINLASIFRDTMKNLDIVRLRTAQQLEVILRRKKSLTESFYLGSHPSPLQAIQMFHVKLKMFVPNKFEEIKTQLCEILILLQKYCVSFFHGKKDPYLETAYSYEQKRKELAQSIQNNIDRTSDTMITYRKGQLTLKHLGLYANELARRSYCQEAPLLFIVPDLCQTVRDACSDIMRWVQLDSGYVSFLYNDLAEIKQKRHEHFHRVRELKEKRCQLNRRIKAVAKDIDDLKEQLETLENKEKEVIKLKVTAKQLEKEKKNGLKDKETNALQKENMVPNNITETGRSRSVSFTIGSFSRRTSVMSSVLDSQSRGIATIRIRVGKFKLMDEKNEALERKKSVFNKLQKLRIRQDTELVIEEHELARLERCYTQLRDIYTFRKSPNITKKIFQSVPIIPRCNAEKGTICGTKRSESAMVNGKSSSARIRDH